MLRDHYLQAIVQYVPRDLASEEVVDSLVESSPVDENVDMASQAQSVKKQSLYRNQRLIPYSMVTMKILFLNSQLRRLRLQVNTAKSG